MPRKKKDKINIYKESVKLSQEITGVMENSALPGIRELGGPEFRFLLKKKLSSMNISFGAKPEQKKRKNRKKNPTGLKGCFKKCGKYYLQVSIKGVKHYIGKFDTVELARNARADFIKENDLRILL